MAEKHTDLSTQLDYFAFENKMRKLIEEAIKPVEGLIEGDKREIQFIQASMQHMAIRVDELDNQTERVNKKAIDIFDLKANFKGKPF
jgi:hypothetical protein